MLAGCNGGQRASSPRGVWLFSWLVPGYTHLRADDWCRGLLPALAVLAIDALCLIAAIAA